MTDHRRLGEAGLTLIEVLVVLAVIGVAAGAMMMGAGDRSRSAETEAVRLARNLTLGVDEAMLSGRPLVLHWDADGYTFGQAPAPQGSMPPEAWPAASLPVLGQRHDLAPPLLLRLRDVTTGTAVVLPVSGAAPSATFDITGSGAAWSVTFDGFSATASVEADL